MARGITASDIQRAPSTFVAKRESKSEPRLQNFAMLQLLSQVDKMKRDVDLTRELILFLKEQAEACKTRQQVEINETNLRIHVAEREHQRRILRKQYPRFPLSQLGSQSALARNAGVDTSSVYDVTDNS